MTELVGLFAAFLSRCARRAPSRVGGARHLLRRLRTDGRLLGAGPQRVGHRGRRAAGRRSRRPRHRPRRRSLRICAAAASSPPTAGSTTRSASDQRFYASRAAVAELVRSDNGPTDQPPPRLRTAVDSGESVGPNAQTGDEAACSRHTSTSIHVSLSKSAETAQPPLGIARALRSGQTRPAAGIRVHVRAFGGLICNESSSTDWSLLRRSSSAPRQLRRRTRDFQ